MNRLWVRVWAVIGLLLILGFPQVVIWAGEPADGSDYEPSSAVYFRVGMFHVVRGEYEQAIEVFSQAITLEPDFDEAIFERGKCYAAIGETDLALSDYGRVISLMPRFGRPYYRRAQLYLSLAQPDAAIRDLEVAVKYMAVVPEPHLLLGDLYYERAEWTSALQMYRYYVKLVGTDAATYVAERVNGLAVLVE